MIDFDFISPTKIYFGKNKEDELSSILSSYNAKSILLVYGTSSIKRIGLYDKVIKGLNDAHIKFIELSGIKPNPSVERVYEGIKIAKENDVDFVLAIGGGSVIDTAKLIADGFYYDGDPFDFNQYKASPKNALPVGVILTLAASGSELSQSCVITNEKLKIKAGFNSDFNRPRFAIMNPELTYSVSKFQTGCGIVDIISHSLERYFCPSDEFDFSDDMALAIIKNIIKCGKTCINEPTNYNARALMMLTGAYSHNGFTGLGKKIVMSIHGIEHALSGYKTDIAHGAGLSVLIPAWMSYVYSYDLKKFSKFSKVLFNLNYDDLEKNATMGIQFLKDYFVKIGMPTTLKELGINEDDIPLIADLATKNGTRMIGTLSIRPLDKKDIINILKSVL